MATININSKRYEIPERLTIEQYQKAMAFDWEDPKYYPMIVSQLTGAPIKMLKAAGEEPLTLAIALIVHQMNQRTKGKMKDLTEITFGEFIDLDVWISLGVDKHLQDMANILCPKAKWADEAMWAVDEFSKFRMFTFRQYQALFGVRDKDFEEAKEKLDLRPDPMQTARSWYKVIVSLAQEDLLKIDKVTEEPLKKALNFMALQKEKALEEQQRQLQQKRQYDLQRTRR
jgi:hypothetical protein